MEKLHPNLRDHLAVSVRSIQWSYSIFWSLSPSLPGVLEWGEGYYNGDIKTRKTVQAMEINADEAGLQRSEQLRDLYVSLLAGKSEPQARRPCAALSPEDLSNTEWYYLVCMSFVFNLGQGLPGRSLLNGKPVWIHNAHQADSKVFCRSLLAKGASIQTVVCFPFLGGVVELGVTDSVQEDLPLIQYVQASLLGIDCPVLLQRPSSLVHQHNNKIDDNALTEITQDDDLRLLESPGNSSDSFGLTEPEKEATFMTECAKEELKDDVPTSCVHNSMNSRDYATPDSVNPENPTCLSKAEKGGGFLAGMEPEFEGGDDLHYRNVLSSISKSTHQSILGPSINFNKQSCFLGWENGASIDTGVHQRPRNRTPQKMLKKILCEVPRMHTLSSIHREKEEALNTEVHEAASSHMLIENGKEKVNERYSALQSLLPSIKKVERSSILDDTITYLKELETRVKELEACLNSHDNNGESKKKAQDAAERTSDNDKSHRMMGGINRKACHGDEENQDNVSVSLIGKDVLIDIRCQWQERLLLEFIEALCTLRLDPHSVQASTRDGVLRLTIETKIDRSTSLSAGRIRQVLERAIMKCG